MSHEEALMELLTKKAESVENNEDAPTAVGTNNVRPDPQDRESGTVDAPWGEPGPQSKGRQGPTAFSNAVEEASNDGKHTLTDRIFSGKSTANSAERALMSANFKHVSSGDFETHSLHLQGAANEKVAHPRAKTLREQVVDKLGRA